MSLPSLFHFLTNSPLVLFTSPDGYIFSTLSALCHRVQRRRALQWSFALKVISLNVHASCCASRAIQRVELLVREKGKRKRKYKRGRSRAWNNCTDFSFDYPLTVHNHHHHYQYFTTTLFCHHGSLVSFFTFFLLSVLWISLTKQNETKRNWATRLRDTSLRSMKPFFSLFYTSFSTFFFLLTWHTCELKWASNSHAVSFFSLSLFLLHIHIDYVSSYIDYCCFSSETQTRCY